VEQHLGHLPRGKQYFSHVTVTDVTDKQIECTITPFSIHLFNLPALKN